MSFITIDFRDRIYVLGGTQKQPIEVHDIATTENYCEMKQPLERIAAVGAILDDHIVICGGKSSEGGRHHTCSVIGKQELGMVSHRYGAASVVVSKDNETMLLIVGMNDICLHSE